MTDTVLEGALDVLTVLLLPTVELTVLVDSKPLLLLLLLCELTVLAAPELTEPEEDEVDVARLVRVPELEVLELALLAKPVLVCELDELPEAVLV